MTKAPSASEQRSRAFFELSSDAIFVLDVESGEIIESNRKAGSMLGYSPAELQGTPLSEVAADASELAKFLHSVREDGSGWNDGLSLRTKDGAILLTEISASVVELGGKERAIAFVRDISERKRIEQELEHVLQHQKMVAREFNHRLRNKLAIVQAIINSAGRRATTVEEYREAVSDRIASLARTNALLVQQPSEDAPLWAVLQSEFDAYREPGHERILMEGPPLVLPAAKVTPFAMAIHELATNAVKHGALSRPSGRIELSWTTVPENGESALLLSWVEQGGPRVAPPEREGFGSVLLKRLLRSRENGSVELDFAPEGLRAQIRLPLGPTDIDEAADLAAE